MKDSTLQKQRRIYEVYGLEVLKNVWFACFRVEN